MQCFPKTKLLFFRRRFFLDPEDHAKQTGQQLRALDNNDFHMKLLSNIHVICHRHTFRVLCPQYKKKKKKGAEKRPEDFWLPNALSATTIVQARTSCIPIFRICVFCCLKRSACRSPIYFLSGYFFRGENGSVLTRFVSFFCFSFCFSFVFLLFFCFLFMPMTDVCDALEFSRRQHHLTAP